VGFVVCHLLWRVPFTQLLVDGVFMHNNTAIYGGALYVGGNASVTVASGLLSDNNARRGAAIYVNSNSSTTLHNVTLTNNNAEEDGAGLCAGDSAQVRCLLSIVFVMHQTTTCSG
jgi:predicted outer membrane repeat protein